MLGVMLRAAIAASTIAAALAFAAVPGRAQTAPATPIPLSTATPGVTHHEFVVAGKRLGYTATAGLTALRDEHGEPAAQMFSVAYTLDRAPARRPVTFVFNGGPGSSSMWLHFASFGPVRVETADAGVTRPGRYTLVENDTTLLDKTDLVFVDAIGTGYSRIVGKGTPKDFYGVDPDAKAFAQFVERWLTANSRWTAPKFALGESYGGPRAALLVTRLQGLGVAFSGLVLVSPALDYAALDPGPLGNDLPYLAFVPSEAAVAWYHGKIPNKPPLIGPFLDEVRTFVRGDYAAALAAGDTLSPDRRRAIAERLGRYIGLDPAYVERANLRVAPGRFEKELLRDRARAVARLDGRFLGIDADAAGETPDYDAAYEAAGPAFTAAANAYLHDALAFRVDDDYRAFGDDVYGAWDFKHNGNTAELNVGADLQSTLSRNPYLRVFAASGYYDLAVPFYATEHTLTHLGLDPSLRGHVRFGFYPSGHMIYLAPESRRDLHRDLAAFYDEAAAG